MFVRSTVRRTENGYEFDQLISTPKVTELLASNPERQLLLALVGTSNYMQEYDGDDAVRINCAHERFLTDPGEHFGDCTGMASSCSLCFTELYYKKTVDIEQEAQDANLQIDLATLLLATEDACDQYAALTRWYEIHSNFDCPMQDSSIAGRLKLWNNLTIEQQQTAVRRATQFRQWIAGPLPPMPDWAKDE